MSDSSTAIGLEQYDDPDAIYSSAGSYWPGWISYSLLLFPTFVFNVITGSLILSSPVLRRNLNSILVVFLALEDGLFSLFCLVQCLTNLAEMQIALNITGCEIQAIYALFLVFCTGYTLCCIAYYNHQRIQGKPGFTFRQLIWIHVGIWAWSALMTWLSADGPHTRARVMPSGTYCFSNLLEVQSALLFFLPGVVFIGSFLIHRYWLIYRYISRQQSLVVPYQYDSKGNSMAGSSSDEDHHHESADSSTISRVMTAKSPPTSRLVVLEPHRVVVPSPRPSPKLAPVIEAVPIVGPSLATTSPSEHETSVRMSETNRHDHDTSHSASSSSLPQESIQRRIRAARKMFAFVLCFFLCSSPMLIMSIYEVAAGTNASGVFSLFAGSMVHMNSLVNPLLYFWTNPKALRSVPLLKRYWHD